MDKVCPKCHRTYRGDDMFCPEDGSGLVAHDAAAATVVGAISSTGDPLLGRMLDGRYQLTELLGVGGMGRVYLAQHRFLKQPRAVKVLHRGRVNDPSELVRFNRTAVHAGTIANDHVAGIYDFGETDDGHVYLAMEYVPGDTLTRMVKKEGPFEPARVVELTRQIANGLDAAHAQGIIHRDLKPDNIMVMRDRNGREMVKIVDFGIAKAIGNESKGVTQLGTVIGTLLYMSPEQLAGGTLDRRSDLYSLGLVVFHLLTGALPFAGSTPEEVVYARFDPAGPRSLAAVRPSVPWPPALQAVIDRALARDVSARFDTADELAEALGSALEGATLGATRTGEGKQASGARQVGGWLSRTRARITRAHALSAAALVVIAAVGAAVRYWPQSPATDSLALGSLAVDTAAGTIRLPENDTTTTDTSDSAADQREPVKDPPERERKRTVPARPETKTSAADPEVAHRVALQRLERYRHELHPDSVVTPAAARAAIRGLESLLPTLRTRNDSLFDLLYQSHAYYHLRDVDTQCAILRRIRDRAAGTRLEVVIQEYFGYGKCY